MKSPNLMRLADLLLMLPHREMEAFSKAVDNRYGTSSGQAEIILKWADDQIANEPPPEVRAELIEHAASEGGMPAPERPLRVRGEEWPGSGGGVGGIK